MDGGDPDMPTPKRLRLDSVNSVYNGLPPPPTAQPSRHPSHPTSAHASSPPTRHHYPSHGLPHPSQPFSPGPGHHYGPPPPPLPPPQQQQQQQQSTSLPPSDLRNLTDPTNIPNRGHHGSSLTQSPRPDSISTYRPPPAPHYTSAPKVGGSNRIASVSEDKDAKPPMAHGGPPASWHVNQDHRNGASMSNGYPQTISPPGQSEPAFHTPPLPPGQHYAQPSVGGYSPAPYMSQYAQGPGQMRRKQVRATQACNHCRSRKQKCDEARPCQFCRENNFDCQYKDVPVPKQDRSMMQLQDSLNNIGDTLRSFVESFNVWKQTVEDRLPPTKSHDFMSIAMDRPSPDQVFSARGSMSEHNASRMPTPIQPRSHLSRVNSMKIESPVVPYSHASPTAAHTSTPVKQESLPSAPQPPATPAESVDISRGPGNVGQDPEALENDHETPAHKLLSEWASGYNVEQNVPALKHLTSLGKKVIDYPMHYEQERGLLRVWGAGEGHDSKDGVHGVSTPNSRLSDLDSPSPASTTGRGWVYGCPPVDNSSPSTMNGDIPRCQDSVGLDPDGKPDFRLPILRTLHESYNEHVHVLHPILNREQLEGMIDDFGKEYSPELRASYATSPAAIPERFNPNLKRKRSGSMLGDGHSAANDVSKGSIERSLRNAIVLLVLALGKVSAHKGTLPHPQADRNSMPNAAFEHSRGSPSYLANTSFRSDRSEDLEPRPKNREILPGLIYYAYATDILGNQQGGNTVAHAQAFLLVSLYLAQFGRVLESWSWISNACRIALVLVHDDYPRINREWLENGVNSATRAAAEPKLPSKERNRLSMVKIVYWTCLSLETDIRAELSTLPSTKVSTFQSNIMYPAGVYEYARDVANTEAAHNMDLFVYSSLLHLRVLLNGAHNDLYAVGKQGSSSAILKKSKTRAELLRDWRNTLMHEMAWNDTDPPSTHPNIARLRAKVYGAMYMFLRPVLLDAIRTFDSLRIAPSSYGSSPASPTGRSISTPNNSANYRVTSDPASTYKELIKVSNDCIVSAIQSTIAFDRIGADPNSPYENYVSTRTGRLILTNIVGTLHAQFGNMIVLAAVWKSPLKDYLPKDTLTFDILSRLFHRTMNILSEMKPNSPILKIDYDILDHIKRTLDLKWYPS